MRQPLLCLALVVMAAPAAAQEPDAATVLATGFAEVSGWVLRSAELVPAERYAWRPTATVRSFAQQIGHLATSYEYYCARAAGRRVEWNDGDTTVTDKTVLLNRLRRAGEGCTATYTAGGRMTQLMANIAHTSVHYGNIVTYLRLMGLVPPSS